MHCLLCHEKIPRLRAWTGKSEFCCDEHAELYKKQTMDRLLVDDSETKTPAPALPIFNPEPPTVDHVLLRDRPKDNKKVKGAADAAEVDELWKLADKMANSGDAPSRVDDLLREVADSRKPSVEAQSAEDALAALQQLAAEMSNGHSTSTESAELLDEFDGMESSLGELSPLDALPPDLTDELVDEQLDEAPELEFEVLERAELEIVRERPTVHAADASMDAPDLVLEALEESRSESLQPPDLAAEFDVDPSESLNPPDLVAEFSDEQSESLEPPDVELEGLFAAAAASVDEDDAFTLADPPEPSEFEAVAETASQSTPQAAAPIARPTPKARPNLRPATELQDMSPSPTLPEGGYPLKPWTDALAIAGPDRSSLLSPMKFLQMRKSSLNGTDSARFDPVEYRASDRIVPIPFPISEPKTSSTAPASRLDALNPVTAFAWPAPLHEVLLAAEMKLSGTSERAALDESAFSIRQPAMSDDFLSRVAHQSRILEPKCSAILSPMERDVFSSAPAEKEDSDGVHATAGARTDREETDGGERAHVADLF